ncbi:MAG: C4-type zinc ribbon domain-containing protein [Verrucomicrobiia bacterium]
MNIYILKLYRLQEIEMSPNAGSSENQELIKQLRGEIPEYIVRHYDRLRNSGKTGVAVLRNMACSGCHMRVPIAVYNRTLGDDVSLCEHCARYLVILEEEPKKTEPEPLKTVAPEPEPIKPEKTTKPPKKRAKTKKAKTA